MLEILKSLLAGTPLEGLLKLFSGLFGDSEIVENQENTNNDSSPQDYPLPSNEPNQQAGTTSTANEDFNFEELWKQVEDVFGGGSHSNASAESENSEIEPPIEPEMEPDEPEIEPNEPEVQPKQPEIQPQVEPAPTDSPEPIRVPEPEVRPMPSAETLEEESLGFEDEPNDLVSDDESLGLEPETETDKRLSSNAPTIQEDESLGLEKE